MHNHDYCVLKFGKINNINSKGQVKVYFAEDGITSSYLPIMFRRTLDDKEFDSFDVNEFVACIMESNLENGIVIGATYINGNSLPGVASASTSGRQYKDGTKIYYDSTAHNYLIQMVAGAMFKITGEGMFTITNGTTSLGSLVNSLLEALVTFCGTCAASSDPTLVGAAATMATTIADIEVQTNLLLT